MNIRIKEYLQSVEISHSFAMNYNHGVQSINTNGKWDLFEPTRFVYAFFAFNMIYAIDWESSMLQNRLKFQSRGNDNFTMVQIQSVINFVYNLENDAFELALLKLDKNREIYNSVSKMDKDYNSNKLNTRSTGNSIAKDFLLASEKFSKSFNLDSNDQFDLLQMSYTVRNNLFHGAKKAHEMKEKGHRTRLLHYGNIILAANESFFEIMKKQFRYVRIENWEVQNNL
jgi:hypothetical protein